MVKLHLMDKKHYITSGKKVFGGNCVKQQEYYKTSELQGKVIPLQARCGPEGG